MLKSFFQTDAWGKFKSSSSWRSQRYGSLLGLERSLPFGRKILYFPELPFTVEALQEVRAITNSKKAKEYMFVRFEFLTLWSTITARSLVDMRLVKAFEDVQPEYRQWIPLNLPDQEILAQMKPKGRYNIKVASRHSLEVVAGTTTELTDDFFALYQETSKRNSFQGRSLGYFRKLVEVLAAEKVGEVLLVRHQGKTVSGGIFLYFDKLGSYLYGGSTAEARSLMAPYLMHWEAIKRSKKHGCQIYDLLAVAPPDKPDHPHAQLSRFKKQFGGETVRLLGSWDFIGQGFWYNMYAFIEKKRRKSVG